MGEWIAVPVVCGAVGASASVNGRLTVGGRGCMLLVSHALANDVSMVVCPRAGNVSLVCTLEVGIAGFLSNEGYSAIEVGREYEFPVAFAVGAVDKSWLVIFTPEPPEWFREWPTTVNSTVSFRAPPC